VTDQWEITWNDYYEILQVSCNAEPEVVEAAFRRLASKYHPDHSMGDEAKMKRINEAHEVLRDPAARSRYDLVYRKRLASERQNEAPFEREPEANGPGESRPNDFWVTLGGALINIRPVVKVA
jgi:DnaJ-class molecular chaperone